MRLGKGSKHSSQIVLASFFLSFLSLSGPVLGAVTVGVHVGDWIQYGNITGSASQKDFNQTQWLKGTVESITGTSVTLQAVAHYVNGTEKTQIFTGDIATGSGNVSFILIPSGLGKGDSFILNFGGSGSSSTRTVTINDTATRSYAGASRTVDLYNSSFSGSYSGVNYAYKFLAYWDQATGLLVEISFSYVVSGSCGGSCSNDSFGFVATNTSIWGTSAGGVLGSSSNLLLYGGIAVIVIVVAAGGYWYMRSKKPPVAAPAASSTPSGSS
jgi:hypothetical protein